MIAVGLHDLLARSSFLPTRHLFDHFADPVMQRLCDRARLNFDKLPLRWRKLEVALIELRLKAILVPRSLCVKSGAAIQNESRANVRGCVEWSEALVAVLDGGTT